MLSYGPQGLYQNPLSMGLSKREYWNGYMYMYDWVPSNYNILSSYKLTKAELEYETGQIMTNQKEQIQLANKH